MVTNSSTQANDAGQSLSVKALLGQYLQYWYLFVLSIALALAGAWWYLQRTTPVYQISAVLLIKDNPKRLSDAILQEEGGAKAARSVENEVELLRSVSLMQRALNDPAITIRYTDDSQPARDQDLFGQSPVQVRPDTLTPLAYGGPVAIRVLNKQQYEWLDADGNTLGKHTFGQLATNKLGTFRVTLDERFLRPTAEPIGVQFFQPEKLAGRYKSTLKIGLVNPNSTVLKLALEDTKPERGKLVLGRLLNEYHRTTMAEKDLEVSNTLKFIDDRLRLISGELNDVERNVETYRRAENITDLSQEGNMFLSNVNETDTKLNEIDVELGILDGVGSYLKNSQNGLAPASVKDPILTGLLGQLSDLQTQHDKYARSMQPDNPVLKGIDTQLAGVKASIQENVANQRQNLQLSRKSLQQLNSRFSSAIRTIPRKEREFINIKRQQGIKESLYLLLLQKKEEAALTYASSLTDSQIIDAPTSSGYPLRPNPKNIYIVALLAGLLLPVGGIVLRNLMSSKVKSRRDIEAEVAVPVLGEIMRKPKGLKDTVIDVSNSRVIAEQFKMLRANLPALSSADTKAQVLLVTSATVGEGKSFFSVNMAFNLSQLNKRVVLLELDLRNPKTTEYLGMTDGQRVGLSSYLNDEATIGDMLRQTPLSHNLYVLSSGLLPPNPAELLSNGRLGTLIAELRQQFDYVVIDTPPVAFVADTLLIGPHADLSFYIVRQGYTPRNSLQLVTGLEASQKFKSLHVIFNGVELSSSKELEYGYGYTYVKTK